MLLSRTPIIWSRTHLFPKLAALSHFHMDAGAVEGLIEHGASPRAAIWLMHAAKAHAFLQGRDYVTPHDAQAGSAVSG